jgi:hypothetical protein
MTNIDTRLCINKSSICTESNGLVVRTTSSVLSSHDQHGLWLTPDRLAGSSTLSGGQCLQQARVDRTEDEATKCEVLALKCYIRRAE